MIKVKVVKEATVSGEQARELALDKVKAADDSEIENILNVEESVLVDEYFNLYEALQDAIDEDGGQPCPQCLYEQLADAACGCPDLIPEAEYRGRKVTLNKPMANPENPKKQNKVYVKNPKTGNVVKVQFGDPNSRIRKSNKGARKSFNARHKCKKEKKPKTSAGYWSCKAW